jgi:hypothetical protein
VPGQGTLVFGTSAVVFAGVHLPSPS